MRTRLSLSKADLGVRQLSDFDYWRLHFTALELPFPLKSIKFTSNDVCSLYWHKDLIRKTIFYFDASERLLFLASRLSTHPTTLWRLFFTLKCLHSNDISLWVRIGINFVLRCGESEWKEGVRVEVSWIVVVRQHDGKQDSTLVRIMENAFKERNS